MFCHYNQNNWGIIEDLFTLWPKDSLFMLHCLGSNTRVQKAQVEGCSSIHCWQSSERGGERRERDIGRVSKSRDRKRKRDGNGTEGMGERPIEAYS